MENFTLFIMGFTMYENTTPVPPNAGSNKGHEFRYIYIFNTKGGN